LPEFGFDAYPIIIGEVDEIVATDLVLLIILPSLLATIGKVCTMAIK
jgi:hypothetical protein